ncbi:hypothetical protein Hanom_Chr09g00858091 [Helianthus anomalus]
MKVAPHSPPSFFGDSTPLTLPDSGPRLDGGGVPDRWIGSPHPSPMYAPFTLMTMYI